MVLLTYFSNYIQLNYHMFTNNIITITTVLYLHVFALVHYLMHLLGLF